MLTRWSLKNFKSVSERIDLQLAPLTLICGANSSGKSTIFQSMLAVAQTFRSSSRTRALILNGQLVRLGEFSDLLHLGADIDEIQMGFVLQDQNQPTNPVDIIQLDVKLISAESLNRKVSSGKVPSIKDYRMGVTWQPRPDLPRYSKLQVAYAPHYSRTEFEYSLAEYSSFQNDLALSGDTKPTHIDMEALAPSALLMEYNAACREAAEDFDRLISIVADTKLPDLPNKVAATLIPNSIFALLSQVKRQEGIYFKRELDRILDRRIHTWGDLIKEIHIGWAVNLDVKGREQDNSQWANKTREVLRDRLLGLRREWLKEIEQRETAVSYERRNIPDLLQISTEQLRRFWIQRFSYLGPLRDDPKVVYAAPTDVERRSVGNKGEYTAAVLREWGRCEVEYPVPPSKTDYSYPETAKGLLIDAVGVWLKHMGLVDDVNTRELAKVGFELTVHSTGLKKPLDLMNVGVGVSQILPTLVTSLIAPQDSTLLFEQPELHLHPRVQSLLGDFFLGMAVIGKQCIIETHSEHLINRIRRRIAEAEGDMVMKLARIYFVQKPQTSTQVATVEPNEYGAIPKWPLGFFDEPAEEADFIIKAATRKRQLKQQRNQEAHKSRGHIR